MADSVTIQLTLATGEAFYGQKIWQFMYKAIVTDDPTVVPGSWWRTEPEMSNTLTWGTGYSVCFFRDGINDPQGRYAVSQGDIIDIADGSVSPGGKPGAVTIQNFSDEALRWGFSEETSWLTQLICAGTLQPGETSVIAPIDRVIVFFAAPDWIEWGSPARELPAPAMLIDLSHGPATDTTVTYDINAGWTGGEGSTTTLYPAGTELYPLLVLPMS